ncbi:receptor-like protein EIX1 [Setaria viridis]|uniref:receptor-like protein EIX1 n=1 Tax=Setaria viridis TaxID=4556 RepID=UPI003B3A5298
MHTAIMHLQHPPPLVKLRRLFTVLALITTSSLILRPPQRAGACVPRERDALLDFKRGVSSDTANVLASWQDDGQEQSDCCRWSGVRCSNRTGHVVELNLRNHAGSLYPLQEGLVGHISSSLLCLPHLRRLDLSWNALEGPTGSIPEFLGSLKNLRYLDLSYMSFSGAVPSQLGNLSKLEHLDLSYYGIFGNGSTESSDVSWAIHLPKLQYIDLGSVNLSATANWHRVMNMLPSLRYLGLSQCSLSSTNPLSLSQLNLTRLETLDLSYNSFDHSEIASCWFWNVTGLRYLNLGGTHLHGQIPEKLGRMTSLQALDLSNNNNLDVMASNLTYLCNLEILNLEQSLSSYVNIVELFEWLPHCSSSKLKELHLHSNNITGCLPPSIEKFTSLNTLSLFDNKLTGPVPSEVGVLSNLTTLYLSNNRLEGVITEEHFVNLNSLQYIDLSDNSLKIDVNHKWIPPFRLERAYFRSCHMGPLFPMWMEWQGNIHNVDISRAGIDDKLPNWFCTTFAKAIALDISNNKISGTLPKCMEIMSVEQLYLGSNKLTGHIPRLPRKILVLFSNYITGQLPGSVCDLQSLIILDLDNNLLGGELPNCNGMRSLKCLQLRNNSFSGQFPSFLQSSTGLILLDLSQNKFSGRLPMWLCDLMDLQFLRLSHNTFSGNIPTNISCLKYLQYLNLANNSMSGFIPYHLSNLTAMTRKNPFRHTMYPFVDAAAIIGDFLVNTKGQALIYHSVTILDVVTLDLSFNGLTGEIPQEIASLDAVLNLNLSWNHLDGVVPKMIGAMQSLESLDLSKNMLSGEIPSSLSKLTSLSYLDLSYNNLTGRIPQGSQLDTLYSENPSMYDGNNGLCGPPLHRNCSRNDTSRSHDQKSYEAGFYPVSFRFGLASGFLLGPWVVLCVLLFKRSWRFAYFRLFDKLYDQIYVFLVVSWRSMEMRYCKGTKVNT